jgi:hypothetical protein
MSALPYILTIDAKIPPLWRSRRSIVQRITLDTDFEIQEIRSRDLYHYNIQMWFGERAGMTFPHRSYNVCVPFIMPIVLPKGSLIQIEVSNYLWRILSNKVSVWFCGNRLYAEPGE